MDTVIISDLHLGSDVSRARDAVRLLRQLRFRRLVLLGDIFCDLNFARLKKEHWKFLSCIRKLSNPRRGVEVVWVEGNHDEGISRVLSHLVGIRVYQQYAWTYAGKRHLAIHGHQFDRFAVNNWLLSSLGAWFYLQLQKIEPGERHLTRWLDKLNSAWLRLSPKVAEGALEFAAQRGVDRIFCGHTHQPMQVEKNGVCYYNSGAWIHDSASYITVSDEGVQIHAYQPDEFEPAYHRGPGEEREPVAALAADLAPPSGLPADAEYESVCS